MMTSNAKHVPLRSCSICRVKGSKYNLIRIVKSPDNQPVIDISGKLPGRGAYICPDSECIELAKKSGRLAHILGVRNIDSNFWSELEAYSNDFAANKNIDLTGKRLRALIGLSRKAGVLIIGVDNIKNFAHKVLVICASDCSDNVKSFAGNYQTLDLAPSISISIQELSEAAGSSGKGVQVAALPLSSGFAKKILALANNANNERSIAFE